MGAANLDKMVEKNRECVGGEILKMCWSREEERNGEIDRARHGSAGGFIGLENLWYRFLLLTGTKDPLVPVRITNRYQR